MKVSDCCHKHGFLDKLYCLVDAEEAGVCPKCLEHCEFIDLCDGCGEDLKECTCDNDPKIFSLVDQVYMPEQNISND